MNVGIWLFGLLVAALALVLAVRWRKRQAASPLAINRWTEAIEVRTEGENQPEDVSAVERVGGERAGELQTVERESALSPLPVSAEIIAHYNRFFACQPEICPPETFGLAIAVYPPTRKRGWWTYATVGLHKEIETELAMYSYKREEQLLAHLAHVVNQLRKQRYSSEESGVEPGDAFSLESALLDGSALQCLLATPPYFEADGFEYYTNGEEVVRILMLHPIAEAESRYLQAYGLAALEALFVQQEVNSLDFYRQPVTGVGGNEFEPDTDESKRSGGTQRTNSFD